MWKKNEEIKKELDDLQSSISDKSKDNDLLTFFIGIVLLAVGLFMLSKRVVVHGGWYIWHFGGFDLSSGTVTIPLIIGIIWYFANPKSIAAKIVLLLSAIMIIVSIIMSVRITFVSTSLFDYILIIGMAAAGAGLLIKAIFKK